MQTLIRVSLFFLCNVIGFNIGPLLYVVALKLNIVEITAENAASYEYDLIQVNLLTWAACAAFSFAYFFLSGHWRKAFLLAPIVVPLLYCLASIVKYT